MTTVKTLKVFTCSVCKEENLPWEEKAYPNQSHKGQPVCCFCDTAQCIHEDLTAPLRVTWLGDITGLVETSLLGLRNGLSHSDNLTEYLLWE